MIKRVFWLSAIVPALAAMGAFGEAVEPKMIHMDAADGKSEGHLVMFVVRPVREGAPAGLAVAATGFAKEEESGPGFGMVVESPRPVAKGITGKELREAIDAEAGAQPVIMRIEVTPEQHSEVKALVAKWSAIEEHIDDASNVTMNFAQEVLDALGLKRPYRSGLGGSNAVQFMGDIPAFNRTSVKDSN